MVEEHHRFRGPCWCQYQDRWTITGTAGFTRLHGVHSSGHFNYKFYVLLTVHLVMILGKWPTWRTILFYVFISILYMFQGTPCSSQGELIVSIQPLVYVTLCQWPLGVQVGKELLSDLHTKRSPTKSDIYQMMYWYSWFSCWWARRCSKHVENWNKYIEQIRASIWSFTKNFNSNRLFLRWTKIQNYLWH